MQSQTSPQSLLNTLKIKMEPELQVHMKNVYSCVSMSTLAAAVGAYVHLAGYFSAGFLSAIGSFGLMMTLMFTPDNGKNATKRLGILLGFALLSGLGLGPLLDVALHIEPAVIPTAFLGTCLIFGCFTLASMISNQTKYIWLGGTLMSMLSVLTLSALMNVFMGSYILLKIHVYVGLLVMCGFILYDTQVIMEKRRRGDKDFIWHSITLFLDLIHVFRYLLVILMDKEKNKKNKN